MRKPKPLNIFVLGLGLIGGSLAKALCARTPHRIFGWDKNLSARRGAKGISGITGMLRPSAEEMNAIDLAIIALPPEATIQAAAKLLPSMRPGALLLDICGVKREIVKAIAPLAARAQVTYLGGHPMAGREVSGFTAAQETLFDGASMLICPPGGKKKTLPAGLRELLRTVGFARIVVTTPEKHDRIIAFTSQLPHLISGAYIKSPTAKEFPGFSAGSFRDLSRVAGVDAQLWSSLFLANRDNTIRELASMISQLTAFRDALRDRNRPALVKLLHEGTKRKQLLNSLDSKRKKS